MRKRNSLAILSTLVFLFMVPSAFANPMSNQDLTLAFGSQIKPQQVAVLSQKEMDVTEGGIGPICIWLADTTIARVGLSVGRAAWNTVSNVFRSPAATGAAAGAGSYLGTQLASGNKITTAGTAGAIAGGLVGGPIGARLGGNSGAFTGGIVGGYTSQSAQSYIQKRTYRNNSNNFGRDIGSYCGMCRNYPNRGYGSRSYGYRR